MSNYKPWKAFERRHAKRMNGVRLWRPDYSDSEPDGHSEEFGEVWDCKALSGQRIVTLFRTCRDKYRTYTGDRNFHLALFDPKQPGVGDLVVCTAERYQKLLEKEKLLDDHVAAFVEWVPQEC